VDWIAIDAGDREAVATFRRLGHPVEYRNDGHIEPGLG